MSKQKDREEFVALMATEGVPVEVARQFMRAAATLHRLAEAECNGDDWRDERGPRHFAARPAEGETACRETSAKVRSTRYWALVSCSSCKSARVEQRMAELCGQYNLKPVFQGDPRGAVFKVQVPSGKTNDWGNTGICVP